MMKSVLFPFSKEALSKPIVLCPLPAIEEGNLKLYGPYVYPCNSIFEKMITSVCFLKEAALGKPLWPFLFIFEGGLLNLMCSSLFIHCRMPLNKLSVGSLLFMKEATCKQNYFYLFSDLLMRHGLVEFYCETNGEEFFFQNHNFLLSLFEE